LTVQADLAQAASISVGHVGSYDVLTMVVSGTTSQISLAAGGESGTTDTLDITTGTGNDDLTVGDISFSGIDIVKAHFNAGNDQLLASATTSAVQAWGDLGDDVLTGGHAADTLDGGAGFDIVDYSSVTSAIGVRVDLGGSGASNDGWGKADLLNGFEGLRGSNQADTITGSNNADQIWGLGGDDVIDGGAGNDIIDGGDGDDTLSGLSGDDTLSGGSGSDIINGGSNNDILYGYYSYDAVGTDLLRSDDGNDTLSGEIGNDTLDGGAGDDTLDGGDGNDKLGGGRGDDTLFGGTGTDTVFNPEAVESGAVGVYTKLGGGDALTPWYFNQATGHWYAVISSGTTGDWDSAKAEAVAHGGNLVTVDDATEEQWLRTTFGTSTRFWIGLSDAAEEGVWTWADSSSASYRHWNSGQPDNAPITGFPDVGEDYAVLNYNTITGAWNDWDIRRSEYVHTDGIMEAEFLPSVDAFGGHDIILGIGTILGTDRDDYLVGNGKHNNITGGKGEDIIRAEAGNDFVRWSAGDGDDSVTLGGGNDTLLVTGDLVNANAVRISQYSAWANIVMKANGLEETIYVEDSGDIADQTIDITTGSANDSVTIFDLQETGVAMVKLQLGAGGDYLDASQSTVSVTAQGGTGNDVMIAGRGVDVLDGGDGEDTIDYSYVDSLVGIDLDLSLSTAANDGFGNRDTLTAFEDVIGTEYADRITGNAANNDIRGASGDDVVFGLGGNDTLWGEAGNDTLDGGTGDDRFNGGAGDDVIKGGTTGVDTLIFATSSIGVFVQLYDDGTGVSASVDPSGMVTVDAFYGQDALEGIDGADGTDNFDFMIGNNADNVFNGWGGDDVLRGNAGNDILRGDFGDDLLEGGTGDDYIAGGAGLNRVFAGAGNDVVTMGTLAKPAGVMDDIVNQSLGDDSHLMVDETSTFLPDYTGGGLNAFVANLNTMSKLAMLANVNNTMGGTQTIYDVL
jgi:Ca2+-binding RTX toxin-like protein